jgi:hypothetical protein
MEPEENNIPEVQADDAVEIYSGRAIFWFALLISPLCAGVLLILNLRAAGYKKGYNIVAAFTLLLTLAYHFTAVYLINFYKINLQAYFAVMWTKKSSFDLNDQHVFILEAVVFLLRILIGLIFTRYFFKRYFPENDYYAKPVGSAVLFSLLAIFILAQFNLIFV